jgi:cell wall assembly regulator SMI1
MFDAELLGLLRLLEQQWAERDPDFVPELRRGLSVREMDAALGSRNLRLPLEAKTWFCWHDGTTSARMLGASAALFSPLARMVERYDQLLEGSEEGKDANGQLPLGAGWRVSWVPLF